jgi:hypothetical protein
VPGYEVLPHLESVDRNVRVAALRVLAWSGDPRAVEGILRGLDDPVRRVREVAAKSCPRFVSDPRVLAASSRRWSVTSAARPARRWRSSAGCSPHHTDSPRSSPSSTPSPRSHSYPSTDNECWSRSCAPPRLTDDAIANLRDVVANGSKDEAVMATRRLCGYRLARRERLDDDERLTAEPAWGHVWAWVPDGGRDRPPR